MATTKQIRVSFHVKEYGDKPILHFIEVEPTGKLPFFADDRDTMYLELRNNTSMEEAQTVAKYLRQHITEITLLTYP
jgi:hypothetical protein